MKPRTSTSYSLAMLAELTARRGDLAAALDYSQQAMSVITEAGAVEYLVLIQAREAQLRWLLADVVGSAAAVARAERLAADLRWPDAAAAVALQGRSRPLVRRCCHGARGACAHRGAAASHRS
jgi:hypothetical protein